MPRQAKGLTAAKVKNAKPGKYFDGRNLKLLVRSEGSKSWSFVFTRDGKKREMGLGSVRQGVTLAKARELARAALEQHLTGIDPLAVKKGGRAAARANAILSPNFEKCALDYIEAHRSAWSNKVHAEQWEQSLRDYANPVIGRMTVGDIKVAHIVSVLTPLWLTKPTTARRLRGRIEKVLGRAKALGLRDGPNPAAWKENLDALLPKLSKVQRVQKHHAAMPYETLGDFMAELRAIDGVAARALEVTVRCAVRTSDTRLATWAEVDLAKRVWVVPAPRMKMGVAHWVPLDDRSVAILQELAQTRNGEFIFQIDGAPLSEDKLLRLLQCDMNRPDATVHGMRASFRTWCSERTSFPREVAEISLAHGNKDKIEAAYDRAEFREHRRQLATMWGEFLAKPSSRPAGDVVAFIGREKHAG
jgi:integrase